MRMYVYVLICVYDVYLLRPVERATHQFAPVPKAAQRCNPGVNGTTARRAKRNERCGVPDGCVRPISLLRVSLLRFVDSNFPGNSLRT